MHVILTLTIIVTISKINSCENPIVQFPLGTISGFIKNTIDGRQYYAFEGIPYAKPPVDELRFEPPEEFNEKWNNTLIANKTYKCLQYFHPNEAQERISGQEDCLYLNIYTSTLDKNAKHDVIVYIHGGAFMFGYGGMYKPTYILNRNVVFVNFNYRLGPFGFLSTEDGVVPGNMGLKDQILVLKWTKKYVKFFGGNPESITLAGTSAGSASVHLHSLIPASEGLYHRAISQSGCALNPWVLMERPLEKARQIGIFLNCPNLNPTELLVNCLKKASGNQLVEAIVKLFLPWLNNPFSPFGVVVDSWSKVPLLVEHPYKLLKTQKIVNKVPWLVSFTSSEGLYPVEDFYTEERLNFIETNWNFVIPYILDYNYTVDGVNKDFVSDKIRKHYFGDKKLSKKTYRNLIQMASNRLYRADIHKTLQFYSNAQNIFVQMFAYRGKHSFSEFGTKTNEDFGAAHMDDLIYILNIGIDTFSDPMDRQMSDELINSWVTFANKGVPEFKHFKPSSSVKNYYRINGPTNFTVENGDFGQQTFWDSLPFLENEKLN